MLINLKFFIFLPIMMMGTILCVSSSSWMSAWIGLEINLMSLAPILINKMKFNSVEASIKYFFIQAMASMIIIFFSILSFWSTFFNLSNFLSSVFFLSLMMKAGVAPLHFWFPQVMECLSWYPSLFILTWQKIAPFSLLTFISFRTISYLFNFFIMSSLIIGILGAINQTKLKLILTYSSIIHSGWILSLSMMNSLLWNVYLFSYFLLVFSLIFYINSFSLNNISDILLFHLTPKYKSLFILNMFSLAGLPPLLGFIIKIMALKILINSMFSLMMIFLMLMTSFLSVYFYMRVMYSSLFISLKKNFFGYTNIIYNNSKSMIFFTAISILSNFIIPFMVLLI